MSGFPQFDDLSEETRLSRQGRLGTSRQPRICRRIGKEWDDYNDLTLKGS